VLRQSLAGGLRVGNKIDSPLTYEAFRLRNRMLPLDGVRACAVLGVLLHHTRNDPFGRLHGFRGVPVFFVLSGFLITTLALREEAETGQLQHPRLRDTPQCFP